MRLDDLQMVFLDPFLVDRARISHGLALKTLADESGVDYRTLTGIYKSKGVLPANAKCLADALKTEVLKLLAPHDPRYQPSAQLVGPATGAAEWECEGYLDQGRQTPNGLYVIVCRMKHRYTQGRLGRGKFYHLGWLATKAKEEMRHKLSRHADTCLRVGMHQHLAFNLVSTPATDGEGWWIIDDWVGDQTLQDRLKNDGWPNSELPRLLHDIAVALDALHRAEVVLRELAPARVLIANSDGRTVLTDFELAKLLDGSPSVSSDWPDDPFRAPEIDWGTASVASDLYSFGQVALAACGGHPGTSAHVSTVLTKTGMPKALMRRFEECLQGFPSKRPQSIAPILKEITRWRGM